MITHQQQIVKCDQREVIVFFKNTSTMGRAVREIPKVPVQLLHFNEKIWQFFYVMHSSEQVQLTRTVSNCTG